MIEEKWGSIPMPLVLKLEYSSRENLGSYCQSRLDYPAGECFEFRSDQVDLAGNCMFEMRQQMVEAYENKCSLHLLDVFRLPDIQALCYSHQHLKIQPLHLPWNNANRIRLLY